jgi:STELLO glycosyltransferase-like protein
MDAERVIVITSTNAPTAAIKAFATGAPKHGFRLIVIGDAKTPTDFALEGCDYYSLERQSRLTLRYASLCPTDHYARKNIGYLVAAHAGAQVIRDTDDDNLPRAEFWRRDVRTNSVATAAGIGWLNVYGWFADFPIWPRGLPLDRVHASLPDFSSLPVTEADCPIQQGLTDENPDVDAIYRLLFALPRNFRSDRRVALGNGSWCPFNSQNSTWFRVAFPLAYLPAYCSFRMADIWRSFVAQRIAWANGWSVLFHEPTVWQQRNAHDLMRDFEDELPGYLHNTAIGRELSALTIRPGLSKIPDNLRFCYQRLCEMKIISPKELELLEAWLSDLEGKTHG